MLLDFLLSILLLFLLLGQSDVEESIKSKSNLIDIINRKGLVVTDILAFLSFAAVGRASHSTDGNNLINVFATAFPFIFSWLFVSPFLGSFTREATSSKESAPKGVAFG